MILFLKVKYIERERKRGKWKGKREEKERGKFRGRAFKNFAKKLNWAAAAALDACTAGEQSFIELANEFLRHVRES